MTTRLRACGNVTRAQLRAVRGAVRVLFPTCHEIRVRTRRNGKNAHGAAGFRQRLTGVPLDQADSACRTRRRLAGTAAAASFPGLLDHGP